MELAAIGMRFTWQFHTISPITLVIHAMVVATVLNDIAVSSRDVMSSAVGI